MKGNLNKDLTSGAELPSLAFVLMGQISSPTIKNSLRSFKNPITAESNVFSGTGTGATTP